VIDWLRCFVQKFLDDRALTLASLIAWGLLNTLLALFVGVVSVATLLLGDVPQVAAIQDALLRNLPAQAAAALEDALDIARSSAQAASLISIGFLLFNASNFFVSLESTFGMAYHVPERDMIRQRILSFAAFFAFTVMVLVSTTLSILLAELSTPIWWLNVVAVFVLFYKVLPNTAVGWRQALPGALVAGVAFVLTLRLFPLYVALFGAGFNIYAAFGTLLLFAFWLYIVGVIVMLGVELNAYLAAPARSVYLASVSARAMAGKLELDDDIR
jgi:YihY family inner membrane protein